MEAWQADPHEFGRGKIHWIKEKPFDEWDDYDPARRKKLLCGSPLDAVPGQLLKNPPDDKRLWCGGCLRAKIKIDDKPYEDARRAERTAKAQEQWQAQREAQAEERRAELSERYRNWDWEPLRQKVLKRDNWQCQGCLEARATTVHHLTYVRLWHEMLFDLVALCSRCHAAIHPHLGGPD